MAKNNNLTIDIILQKDVLQYFIDYIKVSLYLEKDKPQLIELEIFIRKKCKEKELVELYNCELITKEEFCNVLLAHVETNYIKNNDKNCDFKTYYEREYDKIQKKILNGIFK